MTRFDHNHIPSSIFNVVACIAIDSIPALLLSDTAKSIGLTLAGCRDLEGSQKHVELPVDDIDLHQLMQDFTQHQIVADIELFPTGQFDLYGHSISFNTHTRIEDGQGIGYISNKNDEDKAHELILLKSRLNEQGIFQADAELDQAITNHYSLGWVY